MGGRGITYLIDRLHSGVYCGIKSDGVIGAGNVQVDGSRNTDGVNAKGCQLSGAAEGTVTTNDYDTVNAMLAADLRALLLAMDKLYGLEHPGGLRRIALSVILSLLFLLTIYLSVVVIFTGDWFFHLLETHLPHPLLRLIPLSALSSLWLWIRYLLLFCFVLLLVLAIYRLGTPRRFRSSRKLLLSSLFTAVSLVAGSLLFSWFIGLSSRYSMLYGSLASLIILLVWLYFCGNVLLLGALLSQVLEVRRARHHSTGS